MTPDFAVPWGWPYSGPMVPAREPFDFRLAIVGAGPSCCYVLDRLAATADELLAGVRLTIDVFDRSGQFGAGLVHSTRQPRTSYLNRIVGQVAFAADESVEQAGELLDHSLRPTLHQWCRQRFEETGDSEFDLAPEDWPKRYMHGLALRDRFERYAALLRGHPAVDLRLHEAEVLDVIDRGAELELLVDRGEPQSCRADHVLLVTGHSSNDPRHVPALRHMTEFAERTGARYVPSAYPLEDNLSEEITGGEHVIAASGMGLTAIDIILYLTEARGGRFESREGKLEYMPSGREPRSIVPFSEAGLFTFARPFNAKEKDLATLEHKGVFLTCDTVDRLRASVGVPIDLGQFDARRQLDFESHLLPCVLLEMAYVYYRTMLGEELAEHLRAAASERYEVFLTGRASAGDPAAFLLEPVQALVDQAAALIDGVLTGEQQLSALSDGDHAWPARPAFCRHLEVVFGTAAQEIEQSLAAGASVAEALGGRESPFAHPLLLRDKAFSWQGMIQPIAPERQGSREDYRQAMVELFGVDHSWAAQGNVENPAKAATDGVWRDLRPVLAYAIDFGGLTARSHERFLETYMRHHNRLANGAGLEVMERIRALVEQGFVDVSVGPDARVECDEGSGRFRIVGRRTGASVLVDTLVNAKVHPFDPERDVLLLYPNMLRRGLIRKWRNPSHDGPSYEPGGLDLSSDFHPVDEQGHVDRRLTLLGPPSEGVMFFQLGALRPQQNHHVMRDILLWLEELRTQLKQRRGGAPAAQGSQSAAREAADELVVAEEHPAAALRRGLANGRFLRVGGVHDGLSALVADRCGVDALWASGLGIAASRGVPDANILTMGEVREATRTIVSATSLPVIADCDAGFGDVRNLRRTVMEFEHVGVAAICIEDKPDPRRVPLGSGNGEALTDRYEFAIKIRAAKEAQRMSEFLVFARLESLIEGESLDRALERAQLYAEAGADAIVVHSRTQTAAEVTAFAKAWRARGQRTPLVAIPTTYGHATVEELERAGISVAVYANQVLRAAMGAMEETMRTIVRSGTSLPVEETIPPVRAVFELTGEEDVSSYDSWFTQAVEESRRGASAAPVDIR